MDPDSIEPTRPAHPQDRPAESARRARHRVRRADAAALHALRAAARAFERHALQRARRRASKMLQRGELLLHRRRLHHSRRRDGGARGGAPQLPPYPFDSGDELLAKCREHGLELFELVLANERTWRSEAEIRAGLLRIWGVMQACVERGFRQTGVLPGVLKVRRRAPKLYRMLTESAVQQSAGRHGLGERLGARGERRECGGRPRRHRADEWRGRHRPGCAALLQALRARRER